MAKKAIKDLRRKMGSVPLHHKTHLARSRHYSSAEPQSYSERFPRAPITTPEIHSFNAESQYANPGALALGFSSNPEIFSLIEQASQSPQQYRDRQTQIFRSLEEQDFIASTAMAHELEIRHSQQPTIDHDENDEHFNLALEHDLSYEGGYAFQDR
jgi:hypothetical protein